MKTESGKLKTENKLSTFHFPLSTFHFLMRNISMPALILSVQISGENNRRVTIFSPSEGIHFATLYGGPKSKLRSLVSPMNSGVIYLYRDEVKNQTKITDFDVKNCHLSFRENLFKTYASSLATEILIKTKCAGFPEEAWKIVNGFLDGIELSSEEESRLGLIRFLWRYLALLGVRLILPSAVTAAILFMRRNLRAILYRRNTFSRHLRTAFRARIARASKKEAFSFQSPQSHILRRFQVFHQKKFGISQFQEKLFWK